MNEKRFVIKNAYPFDRGEYVFDSNQNKFIIEIEEIIKLLNSLDVENEQLKQEVKQYWAYRDIRKQKIKDLEEQLNLLQNLISDAIQHQKTELGQKVLKEIIRDYNEFLLDHKGVE